MEYMFQEGRGYNVLLTDISMVAWAELDTIVSAQ